MSGRAGTKFARILLQTHVAEGLAHKNSDAGFSLGPAFAHELDGDWATWLGSIRMEQLADSNLLIEAELPSRAPEVLDQESKDVGRLAHHAFMGLLLAKNFVTFAAPTLLIGARWSGGSSVRQVASLPQAVHWPADISSVLQQDQLVLAVRLGDKIVRMSERRLWRLNRSLHLYRQARCEPDGLERLHQYVRALEGATKPPNKGGTTENFISRMADLAGEQHADLFKRLYERRGAVEHLREHEILADCSREARLDLVRDEHAAEYLSRMVLARIVGNDRLSEHFGTADAVDTFWVRDAAERREIWGAPIDPLQAHQGFDPEMLSNDDLNLPA